MSPKVMKDEFEPSVALYCFSWLMPGHPECAFPGSESMFAEVTFEKM